MSNPSTNPSKASAKRSRRLTPDEIAKAAALIARGYQPGQVVTELGGEIPHLKAYHIRGIAKRHPEVIEVARKELEIIEAPKRMAAEAIRLAAPDVIDSLRKRYSHLLPDLFAKDVESLSSDQALLDASAAVVKTPSDASAFMRARLLRQQRQDAVFGIAPPKAAESQLTNQAHLHLHIASQWEPRRVAPASGAVEVESELVPVKSPLD